VKTETELDLVCRGRLLQVLLYPSPKTVKIGDVVVTVLFRHSLPLSYKVSDNNTYVL